MLGSPTFPDREEPTPPMNMAEVHRAWTTADGHAVMTVIRDDQFAGPCRVLEREDPVGDERAANHITRIMRGEDLAEPGYARENVTARREAGAVR